MVGRIIRERSDALMNVVEPKAVLKKKPVDRFRRVAPRALSLSLNVDINNVTVILAHVFVRRNRQQSFHF